MTRATYRKTWRLEFAADCDMVLIVSGGVQHVDTHVHEEKSGGSKSATSLHHPAEFSFFHLLKAKSPCLSSTLECQQRKVE